MSSSLFDVDRVAQGPALETQHVNGSRPREEHPDPLGWRGSSREPHPLQSRAKSSETVESDGVDEEGQPGLREPSVGKGR